MRIAAVSRVDMTVDQIKASAEFNLSTNKLQAILLVALALGAMFLRSGEADLALCGGTESAFMPAIVNGFATMKALFNRKVDDRACDDPAQASRPFSIW